MLYHCIQGMRLWRQGLEEEKKTMKNEVRDQWGSGRCDPGKQSLKHLRKQSPGLPGGHPGPVPVSTMEDPS